MTFEGRRKNSKCDTIRTEEYVDKNHKIVQWNRINNTVNKSLPQNAGNKT